MKRYECGMEQEHEIKKQMNFLLLTTLFCKTGAHNSGDANMRPWAAMRAIKVRKKFFQVITSVRCRLAETLA